MEFLVRYGCHAMVVGNLLWWGSGDYFKIYLTEVKRRHVRSVVARKPRGVAGQRMDTQGEA